MNAISNWFDILKSDFVFEPDFSSLGFYDEKEGKVNLSAYGKLIHGERYTDAMEENLISAIMGTSIHEDIHAAIHNNKSPGVVFREMFLPPIEAAVENVFRQELAGNPNWASILRSPEIAKKINTKVQEPMKSVAYFMMIDEIFATEGGYSEGPRRDRLRDRKYFDELEPSYSEEDMRELRLDMLEDLLRMTSAQMKKYTRRFIRNFTLLCDETVVPTIEQTIGQLLRQDMLPTKDVKETVRALTIALYLNLIPMMEDSFTEIINKNISNYEQNYSKMYAAAGRGMNR